MAIVVPEDFAWEVLVSGFGPHVGIVVRLWWIPVGPHLCETFVGESVPELLAAVENEVIWPEVRSRIRRADSRGERTLTAVERSTQSLLREFFAGQNSGRVLKEVAS
jgi:hypothetical protein